MLCDNQDEVRFANIEFGNPKYIENINGKFLIVWDHVIYIKD